MDQEIRNKLRNVVTQCRRLLEDAITQELEGKYSIFAKKDQVTADPNAEMKNLTSQEDREARKDILDHLEHIKARGFKPKDALEQLIREIAFTHLNRLCAYKMMEAREVYVGGQKFREAVSRGVNSNGVKFYLAEHPEDERLFNTGHQDVAYRHFLDWLGGALSEEIGVLFNPNDPANRLYPRQKTLDEVLELLNEGGIKAEETELREQWPQIWSQDETIGWVYQYFTPKELRDQARKESQAPRNSYELAFRNQFFTPRYVVEFLTDNTLGRIWYEMRKGDTKLEDQCRYMVRRPTETFLKEDEQSPKDVVEGKDDLSQEELLRLPVHIPHRPKKDPRELRILDPACGSGHFLLYCFDLLVTIYEEAYADPDLGPALKKDYPTLDALNRDVPRLILAHNLHGIDIDLRASQIAALALWLRCQRAYQDMSLKKDRPKITRSNFVCAEPMPGEGQMLKEFVGQLEQKMLGQVVEVVFDKMKLAGEAGSLLKIEDEIRDAVATAKKLYVRETTLAMDRKGRPLLFSEAEMDRMETSQQQAFAFDISDITESQFFEQAESRVIETLRSYAERAQNGQRLQRRLFADDAVRGFAFVDLCQKRYDVVLMNPPFGECSKPSKPYLEIEYRDIRNDLFGCFVSRGVELLTSQGLLGALTARTGFFLSSFEKWRLSTILPSNPAIIADLGYGVLDNAVVETAAYCLGGSNSRTMFLRLLEYSNKQEALSLTLQQLNSEISTSDAYCVDCQSFCQIPGTPFAYWISNHSRRLFQSMPRFQSEGRFVKQGLASGDDFRFVRLWWEVPANKIVTAPLGASPEAYRQQTFDDKDWVPFAKGGSYSPFYIDPHLLIRWSNNGQEIRDYVDCTTGKELSRYRGSDQYFKAGLTWPARPHRRGAFSHVPDGLIFSTTGTMVFLPREQHWAVCALLNSDAYIGLLHLLMPRGSAEGGQTLKYEIGYVSSVPIPHLNESDTKQLARIAKSCYSIVRDFVAFHETSHVFRVPFTLSDGPCDSLSRTIQEYSSWMKGQQSQLDGLLREINQTAFAVYGICEEDKSILVQGLSQPSPFGIGMFEEGQDDEKVPETALPVDTMQRNVPNQAAADIVSYAVGAAFGRWDLRAVETTQVKKHADEDPFTPLPAYSPGMLQDEIKCVVESQGISSLPRISPDLVLTEDQDSGSDIVRKIRGVLESLWQQHAESIEKEVCEILNVKELRDYFRKPGKGGFWDDHIARYSKSRRKAPIYWLLQSTKKNYAIWLYYHRLDKDLLFKALVNYVEPKIRLETSRLESLRTEKYAVGESGKEAKRLAKDVERQEDFLSELQDFEDKLRRAANLHLEPDLNDGVVLNIAPLWELVPWKEAKKYWDELMDGKYDWSSIGKQLRQKGLVK
jgi:hypothetical protein